MRVETRRLRRERRTIQLMLGMYCRGNHAPEGELCQECKELLSYAMQRIDRCPFQADKPTCAKCTVHCYKPQMRERVRGMMRYAGPRMLLTHPILALAHLVDGVIHPPKQLKELSKKK